MNQDENLIQSRMKELLDFEYDLDKTSPTDLIKWSNHILNVFKIILPSNSHQILSIQKILDDYLSDPAPFHFAVKGDFFAKCFGIADSTFEDFQKGFLKDLRVEIRAEVETDLLSQAKRLLKEKLKDPPAMIIGAVLEDSLRQLCRKHGVPEGKNIESMNIPLTKAEVYNVTVQKQVTGWADIRNNADHARYEEYSIEQVKLMDQGVTDFIAKYLV